MTSLNLDILEEIIPNFSVLVLDVRESLESIKKFMLSGKEPYQAALRYFSSVDSVAIDSFSVRIYIKKMIICKKFQCGTHLYKFPFDFLLLDDILNVVTKSNKKLEIESYPMSFEGRRILGMLIHKDLKQITLDTCAVLPSENYKFLKNECKFDDARLILCCPCKPIPDEFFEFISAHRSLTTHLENFISKMPNEGTFPAVESLSFDPCFCEQPFDDYSYIYNTAIVDEFLTFLSKTMPNLKKLVAEFVARPKRKYSNWDEVYCEMVQFRPHMFKDVSSQIKGSLWFCVMDDKKCFKNAVKLIGDNPEVEIDDEKNRFIKKFEIHDGLSFEYVLQFNDEEFGWEDSSDEYDDDDFMEEDDSEEGMYDY